jgi:glycosyltransferase involved in cell wall biosynthesis
MLRDIDEPEDIPELERALGTTAEELRNPTISVVIPTLNEARNIETVICRLLASAGDTFPLAEDEAPLTPSQDGTARVLRSHQVKSPGGANANEDESHSSSSHNNNNSSDVHEIIVSDGGSTDATCEIVERLAAELAARRAGGPTLSLVRGPSGRGRQLNLGARAASGTTLLFLHADTWLPDGFAARVRATAWAPGVALGCFPFGLDCNHPRLPPPPPPSTPLSSSAAAAVASHGSADGGVNGSRADPPPDNAFFKMTMRGLEQWVNVRTTRLGTPYGDQALFLRRDVFWNLGGFNPEHPMMEDLDLVQRVKRNGYGRFG